MASYAFDDCFFSPIQVNTDPRIESKWATRFLDDGLGWRMVYVCKLVAGSRAEAACKIVAMGAGKWSQFKQSLREVVTVRMVSDVA